ncbi:MAG: hypothetical protein WCJ45_01785 [bacterium]
MSIVSLQLHVSSLNPYFIDPATTEEIASETVTFIVSDFTGHVSVQVFTVNVGHAVSTVMLQASLLVTIVFRALSFAQLTLKCNNPFVLEDTFIVQSRIVGVASLYPLVV